MISRMKMEETAEPEIYDEPLDEPVLEKLDQISKKLDALNKCSVSTVQMAKKVYAGLDDVKQVSGNLRAEIGKFHTTAARVTQDLKQVDRGINSMQGRVEDACTALETRTDHLLHNIAKEQQQLLDATARQFLASLESPGTENPICKVSTAVAEVRGAAWIAIGVGLTNLVLIVILMIWMSIGV